MTGVDRQSDARLSLRISPIIAASFQVAIVGLLIIAPVWHDDFKSLTFALLVFLATRGVLLAIKEGDHAE